METTMKTMTKERVHAHPTSHDRDCVPCDLPPFCRNNFFTGKLLTERDLTAEQRYQSDKLRLHHLALHGWGVVCGLRVRSHPYCPTLKIIVEPGLAIDPCGRFIRVPKEVEVVLPAPIPLPSRHEDPCPPEYPRRKGRPGASSRYGRDDRSERGEHREQSQSAYREQSSGHHEHDDSREPEPPTPEEREPEYPEPEPCDDEPHQPTVDLYVCLAYAECEDEMMPAPFDECACSDSGQKPNRICETYKLSVMTEEPPGLDEIKKRYEECESDDCCSLYESMLDCCPEPVKLECLPLAVIVDHTLGDPVTEDDIDNMSVRPLLPSTQLLDQMIRCLCDKVPTKALTKIVDIGWTHRGEYHCHDFMRQFVGDGNTPKGFEVTFGNPVRTEGLTPRTFQAVAVRYPERHGGGQIEIVPGRVRWSGDRLRAYLDIDREYAERRLDGQRFDLYLRLRCSHIVDDAGQPVDGDLLARIDGDGNYTVATPTGDGVPGGTFESWIRVRSGPRE
jgi:hypothetical protein